MLDLFLKYPYHFRMEGKEISIELVASMSADQLPVSDLSAAIVAIAGKLVEIEDRLMSASANASHSADLTMKDMMSELKKSYWTVYNLIQRGLIRRDHSSRKITVRRKDFEEFKKSVTW
jgi:hypothetical protein